MKNLKKIAVIGAVALALSATSIAALAASNNDTLAGIVAGLTGKSEESIAAEKAETGLTYGTIANEYGVLDQFKSQMLEQKEAYLDERVSEGTMTQERADAILTAMETNQTNCDGSGSGGAGSGMGAGFGGMNGNHGRGNRNAAGNGSGLCMGNPQD